MGGVQPDPGGLGEVTRPKPCLGRWAGDHFSGSAGRGPGGARSLRAPAPSPSPHPRSAPTVCGTCSCHSTSPASVSSPVKWGDPAGAHLGLWGQPCPVQSPPPRSRARVPEWTPRWAISLHLHLYSLRLRGTRLESQERTQVLGASPGRVLPAPPRLAGGAEARGRPGVARLRPKRALA